jgi:hypothetical protein
MRSLARCQPSSAAAGPSGRSQRVEGKENAIATRDENKKEKKQMAAGSINLDN